MDRRGVVVGGRVQSHNAECSSHPCPVQTNVMLPALHWCKHFVWDLCVKYIEEHVDVLWAVRICCYGNQLQKCNFHLIRNSTLNAKNRSVCYGQCYCEHVYIEFCTICFLKCPFADNLFSKNSAKYWPHSRGNSKVLKYLTESYPCNLKSMLQGLQISTNRF